MLCSGHGALRIGKAFPRATTAAVTDFGGISSFAFNAPRSTMAWFGKGQSLYVFFPADGALANSLSCAVLQSPVPSKRRIPREHGTRAMALCSGWDQEPPLLDQ